jgi:hypothetical protein
MGRGVSDQLLRLSNSWTPWILRHTSDCHLGSTFCGLDRKRTYELITKYIDIENRGGKQISFGHDDRIHDLIFRDTNGHVGAIRTFLFHAVSFDMKTPAEILRFVSQKFYQTDLRGFRAFLSVDAEKIAKIPLRHLALLIQCIVLYKQGHRNFSAVALNAVSVSQTWNPHQDWCNNQYREYDLWLFRRRSILI